MDIFTYSRLFNGTSKPENVHKDEAFWENAIMFFIRINNSNFYHHKFFFHGALSKLLFWSSYNENLSMLDNCNWRIGETCLFTLRPHIPLFLYWVHALKKFNPK